MRSFRLAAAGGACLALAHAPLARADLYLRSPIVEYREAEFEHNGYVGFGKKGSAVNGLQSYTYTLGYGLLPFWKVELEAETGSFGYQNQRYSASTIENTFQLVPEGKYDFDLGLFAEYSRSSIPSQPSGVTAGPIVRAELGDVLGLDTLHTLNLFVSRDIGPGAAHATGFLYAAQSKLLLTPLANPGVELFGALNSVTDPGLFNRQTHSAGPVVTGERSLGRIGKLRYEVGYQFGLTSQAPRGAVRWKFEYELFF